MKKETGMTIAILLSATFIMTMPQLAQAVMAPVPGSFAYDIYNIAINQILNGPIGFVGGAVAIVLGAAAAIAGNWMASIPAILGGAAMLNADGIVRTMGMII